MRKNRSFNEWYDDMKGRLARTLSLFAHFSSCEDTIKKRKCKNLEQRFFFSRVQRDSYERNKRSLREDNIAWTQHKRNQIGFKKKRLFSSSIYFARDIDHKNKRTSGTTRGGLTCQQEQTFYFLTKKVFVKSNTTFIGTAIRRHLDAG